MPMFIPTLANTAKATTHAVTNINVNIINSFLLLVIVKQSFFAALFAAPNTFSFFFDAKVMPFVFAHKKTRTTVAIPTPFIDFSQ